MLAKPRDAALSAAWQPVGPAQIGSLAYGNVTGRVTAVATDPADTSGNTVYLGTTGGGVWKSTNAAGPAANVQFSPLTDTLGVFNGGSEAATASLSIGALSVANGVVLAGTGDPNDALDSYYGSGLLRSADGGTTWNLVQESRDGDGGVHSFLGLGFAGFAWSTATPSLVVAAVSDAAEGTLVNAADAVYSERGLFYSNDAGVSWQMATILDGNQTVQGPQSSGNQGGNAATSVAWNPLRQRFYAAVRFHGYYESADGATWTRMAAQPGSGLTKTACPANPGTTGSPGCPIFRGTLAVEPVSGDMYALTVDANNLDQGLWRDVCNATGGGCAASEPTFGARLNSAALEVGSGSAEIVQGDYDLSLAAVNTGPDTLLFAGTVDLFRCSIATGCVFRDTTNTEDGCAAPAAVAPSQHAIATLALSTGTLLYLGNDGGLWRSTDGVAQTGTPCSSDDAAHFQNLNGGLGSLAEVVGFAQHPTDANTLIVGVGANGTAATSAAASNLAWPQLAAGEGGFAAIDPATPANWYISTGPGVSVKACAKGAACGPADFTGEATIGAAQTGEDASLVDAPWMLDPAIPSNLLVGTCRVWRGPAADGTSWSTANLLGATFGGELAGSCGTANPVVRSIAAGGPSSDASAVENSGSEVIYAGLAGTLDGGGTLGGHLFATAKGATATGTTAWSDVALSPVTNVGSSAGGFNPGGFDVSSVTVDPHDPTGNTVYATVMGFAGNGIDAAHLYGSTDGGAHWLTLSGNLPNAPANSVAVDPNDANTLYVAEDTGVYATRQISSCATEDCWSVYGTSLPNAPVVQLLAAAEMSAGNGLLGVLRAATYGRGIWEIPLLTAAPVAAPVMSLSPTSLTFVSQATGTASATQSITVTNSGNAALTITSVVTTGDFNETDNCAGVAIAAGASCTVQVEFLPTATGARAGLLTIYGNVKGGQATAALSGMGTTPAAVVLDPISMTFPTTTVGATSAAEDITISNTGGEAATLQSVTVSGAFQIAANTCGSSLGAQVGCTVSIVFAPTASGKSSGSLTVVDSTGTQTASLTGLGASVATDALSPMTLNFAAQQVSTVSTGQQVTLTNSGDSSLLAVSGTITGGDFTVTSGCGASLTGHSTCAFTVRFAPTTIGPRTGVLTVSDQTRSQTVALSGTGLAGPGVTLTPTGLSFPATVVGQTATAITATLSNQGGVPLTVSGIAVSGDFALAASGSNCGASVAAGGACTLSIAFTPTAPGARAGAVTIMDNAAGSPQTIALSGTGVGFTLSANGPTSMTVSSGSAAVYALSLNSPAGVPGMAAIACSGTLVNATCSVSPSTANLGANTAVTVTVATGVLTNAGRSGTGPEVRWGVVALPMLMFFGSLRRRRGLLSLLVFGGLLLAAGCGSGRLIPQSAGENLNQTPSGTYPFTVTASSAGVQQTVNLTLVVQ
jgi:hypothetical protein